MEDRLTRPGEAAGAVGHQALALGARIAWQRLVLRDRQNLHSPAFGRVQRDHVVADRHRSHAFDPPPRRCRHGGKMPGSAPDSVKASVDAGGDDAYQHFAGSGRGDVPW